MRLTFSDTIIAMDKFDKTVRPQDDFFGYVNNNWINKHPIPDDESIWGTFYELREKSKKAIKQIVNEFNNVPDSKLSHNQILVKTFFRNAMHFSEYKKTHLDTIKNEINKINAINSADELAFYLGYAHRCQYTPFWTCIVDLDDKNSQIQVIRVQQDGLNLPNRDYYLDNTAKMKSIRKQYEIYFNSVQNLIPNFTVASWDKIFNIEKLLAKSSWTDIQLRDINKNYNRYSLSDLGKRFPDFNWNQYFKGQNWECPNDNIIIDQPSFIDDAFKLINTLSLNEIKQYLSWNAINCLVSLIDEKSAIVKFNFYGKVISGNQIIAPTWKRTINQTNNFVIGQILGHEYTTRHFPEESKKDVLQIVEDIRLAYHKHIDKITWMTEKTKKRAHVKLDNFRVFIGYPSKWDNFSKLELVDGNHIENTLRINKFCSDLIISKVGKIPNPNEWEMNAHDVNAYNSPSRLVICFPAGILQPPFYNPKATKAQNLGGIGAVIGHELTHGFDDQGSEFDEFGNFVKWQTLAEKKSLAKLSLPIVKQANSYQVLPGINLKGKLVIGEAVADLGGLELAIEALKSITKPNQLTKSLKQLFINSAICERSVMRDELMMQIAKIDVHPPASFRINGIVRHINDFYSVFDVRENDLLYLPPENRTHIW